MRAIRLTALLSMTVLLMMVPAISPGGFDLQNKGPFDINPRNEEPNTPFDLSVQGGDGDLGDPEGSQACRDPGINSNSSASSGGGGDAVLLGVNGFPTNVRVQVVDEEGNAGPPNTVLAAQDYDPEGFAGTWGSPPTIPFPEGLPAGTYLVTAFCEHLLVFGEGPEAESSSSSGSAPAFVLLGNGEEPQCTERNLPDPPGDTGPGCYEAQELVIQVAAAEPVEEEPTFAG